MTTALNDIVDDAEDILHDTGNDRWTAIRLARWGAYAETAICLRKPDAYVKNESFVLVAGTRQSIAGTVLMDIVRNMGTDGSTEGAVITKVEKAAMDAIDPDWHTATASATIKHWMHDLRDPKKFYVYPQQPSSGFGYVDAIWSEAPASIGVGDNITLDDIYRAIILDYILFRAYAKDAALHPNAAARAGAHAQMFIDALGSKERIEAFYATEGVKRG